MEDPMIPNREKATEILIKNKRETYLVEMRKKGNNAYFNTKRMKMNYFQELKEVESHILFKEKEYWELADMLETSLKFEEYGNAIKIVQSIRQKHLDQAEKGVNHDEIFKGQIVETMIRICSKEFNFSENLQYEACWLLLNLCTEEDEKIVSMIKKGLIQAFYDQLRQENLFQREQALWGLANVAGIGIKDYLKEILETNIIEEVCSSFFTYPCSEGIAENISCLAFSLCSAISEILGFDELKNLLPLIDWAISSHMNNENVLSNSFWALDKLTENLDTDQLSEVLNLNGNIIQSAVAIVIEGKIQSIDVLAPIAKFLGNFIFGDQESTTQYVKSFSILDVFEIFLGSARKALRKKALWSLSNLLANSETDVDMVFNRPSLVMKIINLAKEDPHFDLRKEALIALSNSCCTGENHIVRHLVSNDIIELFCTGLEACDNTLILNMIQGLSAILYYGRVLMREENYMENPYVINIIDCGGHLRLEELQKNENPEIYKKTLDLISTYFDNEDQDPSGQEDQQDVKLEAMNFEV